MRKESFMASRIISVLACSVMAGTAYADPLPAPQLQQGQYVYVIPNGWQPPLFGPNDIAQLNAEAQKLHFPFYVVLVQSIPGSGNGDELAANAVDGLAQDWAATEPSFDVAKSQVFLLSYAPRKYRIVGGAKWKAELGMEKAAWKPYLQPFERAVEGTPKDPKGGIIAVMGKVDAHLFDRTDPVRVAARQEAERKQAEENRLRGSRGTLDAEIGRLSGLLAQKDYLPEDAPTYHALLDKARTVRKTDDPAAMSSFAAEMKPSADVLAKHVDARRTEANNAMLLALSKWAFGLLIASMALFAALRRHRTLKQYRAQLDTEVAEWEEKIRNASAKYVDFFMKRDAITALAETRGATKGLYESITTEVDAIYSAVKAMELHIKRCALLGGTGGFFNLKPLRDAQERLENEFDFDTGELNETELFGKETKTIKIKPTTLAEDLAMRFSKAMGGWQRLHAANDMRLKAMEVLFPHMTLDALFRRCDAAGIPHRWIAEHPLFGDETSDCSLYETANAIRSGDPVSFADALDGMKAKEADMAQRVTRLEKALVRASEKRIERLVETGGTMVDPTDDPTLTHFEARSEDAKLKGLLASSDSVDEIEKQADLVRGLYEKCLSQEAVVLASVEAAKNALQKVADAEKEALSAEVSAKQTVAKAKMVRASVSAEALLLDGKQYIEAAQRDRAKAERQQAEGRHLNALRNADASVAQFESAKRKFETAIEHCAGLDQQKAAFEAKRAVMNAERTRAAEKIKRYGGSSTKLAAYNEPAVNGVVDYLALSAILNAQENSWHQEARRAQESYEAAERAERAREAAEQRRRDDAEAAERRRRDDESSRSSWSNSSSSSSSGGSWGGGGSSSAGGDW